MPINRELKRLRDEKYRQKKKDDPDYRRRRNEAAKKSRTKKKISETARAKRIHRKNDRERQRKHRNNKKNNSYNSSAETDLSNTSNSSKSHAATEREKNRAKLNLLKLKLENKALTRKTWRLSKRLSRKKETYSEGKISPSKMADETMKSSHKSRKTLTAHFSLMKSLRATSERKKVLIDAAKIVVKKSKLRGHFKTFLIDYKTLNRIKQKSAKPSMIKQMIIDFYNRDDNSRMTSGKKETITKN